MRSLIGRIAPIGLALLVPPSALAQATPEGGPAGVFRRATLELALDPDGGYRLSEESGTLAQGRLQGRDTLAAVDVSGPRACEPADTGRYLIRSSTDSLWLVAVREPCHRRSDALAGGWRRLAGGDIVALAHATVIDGTGAPARPDQTIVLRGGTIADVFRPPRSRRHPMPSCSTSPAATSSQG